jgi:AcrR family transcriptional regulator
MSLVASEERVASSRQLVSAPERFERILVEATRLFSENGYAGTRMSDIAAAIGVTKPIVYRHFDSKQALFEALVRRVLSDQIRIACEMIDGHTGPIKPLLAQLVRDARAGLATPGALAPWRIAVGEADRFPDLALFLRTDFLEPVLQLFCSPLATVAMLLATFGDGDNQLIDVDAFLTAHVDGFWRGWALV